MHGNMCMASRVCAGSGGSSKGFGLVASMHPVPLSSSDEEEEHTRVCGASDSSARVLGARAKSTGPPPLAPTPPPAPPPPPPAPPAPPAAPSSGQGAAAPHSVRRLGDFAVVGGINADLEHVGCLPWNTILAASVHTRVSGAPDIDWLSSDDRRAQFVVATDDSWTSVGNRDRIAIAARAGFVSRIHVLRSLRWCDDRWQLLVVEISLPRRSAGLDSIRVAAALQTHGQVFSTGTAAVWSRVASTIVEFGVRLLVMYSSERRNLNQSAHRLREAMGETDVPVTHAMKAEDPVCSVVTANSDSDVHYFVLGGHGRLDGPLRHPSASAEPVSWTRPGHYDEALPRLKAKRVVNLRLSSLWFCGVPLRTAQGKSGRAMRYEERMAKAKSKGKGIFKGKGKGRGKSKDRPSLQAPDELF